MCDHPNMNVQNIERLITDRTKVIVPVHYAGVAVDMDAIMGLAMKHNLFVVEDAAQSIDSYYKSIPLGSFGDLSCFSFHETKNITAGEGGLLVVNSDKFVRRSEILWEKGTNRSEFFRGEVNKYGWVDIGSSFLPSEFNAAVLLAQLEQMDEIQKQRIKLWDAYNKGLSVLFKKGLLFPPKIPEYATNNGHIYFVVCKDNEQRTLLMTFLKEKGIQTTFHYLSLHKSQFAIEHGIKTGILSETDRYTECLLRLPLFCSLSFDDVENIISSIYEFFKRV
jgi:dTDP-4-amino-4,6-dideoxygalactose transaminase